MLPAPRLVLHQGRPSKLHRPSTKRTNILYRAGKLYLAGFRTNHGTHIYTEPTQRICIKRSDLHRPGTAIPIHQHDRTYTKRSTLTLRRDIELYGYMV